MMDHLTRFTVLTPIPNKSAVTVAQAIINRIIGIFGSPEMLHSDQGPELALLPFIPLAYNTSFSSTIHETPFFLMFGRKPRLPVDIILCIPHVETTSNTEDFSKTTQENLQLAFELARRNLSERTQKQAAQNAKLRPIPVYKPGELVLVYRPYQDSDGPIRNCFYRGADRTSFAPNYPPWYIE